MNVIHSVSQAPTSVHDSDATQITSALHLLFHLLLRLAALSPSMFHVFGRGTQLAVLSTYPRLCAVESNHGSAWRDFMQCQGWNLISCLHVKFPTYLHSLWPCFTYFITLRRDMNYWNTVNYIQKFIFFDSGSHKLLPVLSLWITPVLGEPCQAGK